MRSDELISRQNVVVVSEAIGILIRRIRNRGLRYEYRTDFSDLKRIVDGFNSKSLSTQADLDCFDFTEGNSFWIGLFNDKDQCVSVQAARMDDLGATKLAQHWASQQIRIYEGGELGTHHPSIVYKMSGKVVYHGDMYLIKEYRGDELSEWIPQLGYLVALQRFNPDYLYIFMSEKGIKVGYQTRVGFSHQKKRGTHWIKPPNGIDADDYICWFESDDLLELAEIIVRDDQ